MKETRVVLGVVKKKRKKKKEKGEKKKHKMDQSYNKTMIGIENK